MRNFSHGGGFASTKYVLAVLVATMASRTFAGDEFSLKQNRASDDTSWFATIGALYSDNIAKSTINKTSETIPKAGLGLTFRDGREYLQTDLEANVGYSKYTRSFYGTGQSTPEQFSGAANLLMIGSLIPERLRMGRRELVEFLSDSG